VCLFSDSDAEGEDLAQPEFRGLWEEGVHKVSEMVWQIEQVAVKLHDICNKFI